MQTAHARLADPTKILTQVKPMSDVIAAFEAFDRREGGWIKVELKPQREGSNVHGSEETLVDEAVADTFPASDPTSMQNPR